MNRLLRLGMARGNRFFTTLGIAMAIFRVLQSLAGTKPKTLYKHELEPGDELVVSHRDNA